MEKFIEIVTNVNGTVNSFVWGLPMLVLLVGTGILMTILTKGFQVLRYKYWQDQTIGSIFKDRKITAHTGKDDQSISQFQSLCTALAATIGTGNIAGVSAAIISGGPGAIFWMWIVALFGMMTNFSENVLGIFYRRKNEKGEWQGGAMYYLRDGLGSHKGCKYIGMVLAVLFSIFCVLASFGIGNMSQINSIATNMENSFGIAPVVTGVVLMIVAALVVVGGLKRIASVTEKLVPFMAIAYVLGSVLLVCINADQVTAAIASIFRGAFGVRAVGGGLVGSGVKMAITWGMKRGVFSNEAGLGSSVMVHSSSNVKEPVQQGMWGIFEVFMDTIVVCTLTALTILTSGIVDLSTGTLIPAATEAGLKDTALVAEVFRGVFGPAGAGFIAIAILLFAFSTVLGWSHYGATAFEYLFGRTATMVYKVVFVLFIVVGATMKLSLAWDLSDTFNGLMAIPNLIGVLSLSGVVMKITKNYVNRKFRESDEKPMYSAFEDIQAMQEQSED